MITAYFPLVTLASIILLSGPSSAVEYYGVRPRRWNCTWADAQKYYPGNSTQKLTSAFYNEEEAFQVLDQCVADGQTGWSIFTHHKNATADEIVVKDCNRDSTCTNCTQVERIDVTATDATGCTVGDSRLVYIKNQKDVGPDPDHPVSNRTAKWIRTEQYATASSTTGTCSGSPRMILFTPIFEQCTKIVDGVYAYTELAGRNTTYEASPWGPINTMVPSSRMVKCYDDQCKNCTSPEYLYPDLASPSRCVGYKTTDQGPPASTVQYSFVGGHLWDRENGKSAEGSQAYKAFIAKYPIYDTVGTVYSAAQPRLWSSVPLLGFAMLTVTVWVVVGL
jgi:hypothetical protein